MDTEKETQPSAVSLPADRSCASTVPLQSALESNHAQPLGFSAANNTTRPHNPEDGGNEGNDGTDSTSATKVTGAVGPSCETLETPLSKNAQKKLKRQQKWENMRDDRKRRRKEKRIIKQEKRRTVKPEIGGDSELAVVSAPKEHTLVPVSLVFDCDFESYMRETELISLASQITRSYAANRAAKRCVHIYVSSWGGKLLTRYETLLSNQHKRWSHVSFLADDFVAAARQADMDMQTEDGGAVVEVLQDGNDAEAVIKSEADLGPANRVEAEAGAGAPNIVYLTSDSPNTLSRLEPYTSYVIGGIVDKNREKGLCYGRAQARGIRTAKLPIGDYMVMASRQVLTTNHVVEIMLKWLEAGDWAIAFDSVIPKRKGGHLKGQEGKAGEEGTEGIDEDNEIESQGEGIVEEQMESDGSTMNCQDIIETGQTEAVTAA
ncbi:tRNA (guanine(9)-N(1))-methyltransferase [Sporothrix epigloea]|uniref:tRNA (guanine(9)-N1)-methyltransferase n=1 Tax=Sporothrix epigloea TaxID=1892477 RepID=A0ABP0D7E2_9PEZI